MKCPYCQKLAEWTSNEIVYGKKYGRSFMCYYCKDCDAYVGCHNNTRKPLGTMANKELRQKRIKAHAIIDELWKSKKYFRRTVYKRLSEAFGKQVHIGLADQKECDDIIKTAELIFQK